jgi:hypothetical protein
MDTPEITRARINAAFFLQVAHAPLPQSVTVQKGVTVTLDRHTITVSEPHTDDIAIPAHVREGRVWPGTRAQEDRNRARVRALDEERDRMAQSPQGLSPEADDALDLAERTVSRNAVLRYLTASEAAQAWHVSPRRVRQLASTDRIPGAQKMGRDWLIPPEASITPKNRGPKGVTFMWQIINTISGADLGTYPGRTATEALDAMAQEAGYADYAALAAEIPAQPGEILVTRA